MRVQGTDFVSPTSSGFAHGVGLFETCALLGRSIVFFDEHWARLESSAKSLELPFEFQKTEVIHELDRFLRQAGDLKGFGLKLTLFEDEPGHSKLLWNLRPKRKLTEEVRTRLNVSLSRINECDELAGHKTLNYWSNRRGLDRAAKAGVLDSLCLNSKGRLAECWASNVFVVTGCSIHTPPLEDGGLPGIVREVLLRLAHQNAIAISETSIGLDDVLCADAVFVTNSLIGVQPITQIKMEEGSPWVPADPCHPLTERIVSLYAESVAESISSYALTKDASKG